MKQFFIGAMADASAKSESGHTPAATGTDRGDTVPSQNPVDTSSVDTTATDKDETVKSDAGMFSGWTFGMQSVTGGINELFGGTTEQRSTTVEEPSPSADGLGTTAASIATAATTELEHAGKVAQASFGKAAEEIGKGWGTLNNFLDDILAPASEQRSREEAEDDETPGDVNARFHELFPDIKPDEVVVDHFTCTLLQKYRCYLNNATPEKAFPLTGVLYVTTAHLSMYVKDDVGAFGGTPFGITVPFMDVLKIQKGQKSMLRLITKSQSSYVFAGFESDTHFRGALALLEHVAGSSEAPSVPSDDVPTPALTESTTVS